MSQVTFPLPRSSMPPSPRRLACEITSTSDKEKIDAILGNVLNHCLTTQLLSPFFRFVDSILIVYLSLAELTLGIV
jgi:hypothetical protein